MVAKEANGMKITKLAHSCLLVEMPQPVNRTVLFDPGAMSAGLVHAANLVYLDDIVITHEHFDHCDESLIAELVQKFPEVRITAPQSVVDNLRRKNVEATVSPPEGLTIFDAPHEDLAPMGQTPEAIGVHYLGALTHPGDSHSITESMPILALPITAPWGSTTAAVRLATQLKPKYVIPIHDWMWRDEWRQQMYGSLSEYFKQQGIEYIEAVDGKPFVIDVAVT